MRDRESAELEDMRAAATAKGDQQEAAAAAVEESKRNASPTATKPGGEHTLSYHHVVS